MTTPQTIPDWVYVFVSPHCPMAVMNLKITGQYTSPVLAAMTSDPAFAEAYANGTADFLPFIPNGNASTGFLSPFVVSTTNLYRVEWDAEQTRRAFFKNAPSRLTGIYAFETIDDCRSAAAKHNWSLGEVQRFKLKDVLRATRVNMEIVSLARFAYSRAMLDQRSIEHLWRAYWSGEDDYAMNLPSVDATQREDKSAGTLWEWIIDGSLVHESRVIGTQ